jgi:hypothetical protein
MENAVYIMHILLGFGALAFMFLAVLTIWLRRAVPSLPSELGFNWVVFTYACVSLALNIGCFYLNNWRPTLFGFLLASIPMNLLAKEVKRLADR